MSALRIFFITAHELVVYRAEHGCFIDAFAFKADRDGLEGFSRYLAESEPSPAFMLVDVVEEEFRIESVPRVPPWDHRALLKTIARRHFRSTPFHHAEVEPRRGANRRHNRILISALTRADVLQPWLERIDQVGVPLKAISSVPYCMRTLFPWLEPPSDPVLVATHIEGAGLRQTLFQQGNLKFSRLSPLPCPHGGPGYADFVFDELSRTWHYLQRLQLLEEGRPLSIHILDRKPILDELRGLSGGFLHHIVLQELESFVAKARLECTVEPSANLLLAHLFAKARHSNIYAPPESLKHATRLRTRRILDFSLYALLALAAGTLIHNGLLSYGAAKAEMDANRRFVHYRTLLRQSAFDNGPENIDPELLQRAVQTAEVLQRIAHRPDGVLKAIAKVLNGFPAVNLNSIEWAVKIPAESIHARVPSGPASRLESRADEEYATTVIKGQIDQGPDYRSAVLQIETFAEALRHLPGMVSVEIEMRPLEVNTEVHGGPGSQRSPAVAPFILDLVLVS